MQRFVSFDGVEIAYHDEGQGPAVILLHGYGVDGLGQFGDFNNIIPILEKRQAMFRELFGGAPPLPIPPEAGRRGLFRTLIDAGARVILPDMRGFGESGKPRQQAAYEDSAMARDVIALIEHLRLDEADVLGFSMGAGTAAKLLILHPPQLRCAVLAGVSDYIIEATPLEFPPNVPVPESVSRPITMRSWAEEGARILEKGEVVPGHLASVHVIAARVIGADMQTMAAILRGSVGVPVAADALRRVALPVLIVNGKADTVNRKVEGLLEAIPKSRAVLCEGDHATTTYQPDFQQSVIAFLKSQWNDRQGR